MPQKLNFTKGALQAIEPPADGRDTYHDTKVPGLLLRVTPSGIKTFGIQKRIKGKVRRVTLGRFPGMTVDQARKEAWYKLAEMAEGVDPVAAKRAEKARSMTLDQVFEDYLATRKSLKPKTVSEYRRVLDKAVPDWRGKPVTEITKDDIAERHASLGKNHGPAWANLTMRTLRALFNFARKYEDEEGNSVIAENPVQRLSLTRAWYQVDRRRNVIGSHQLPHWFDGVEALESEVARDYLLFLLFTGMRRGEAARLRWTEVSFQGRTFTVYDTKNGEPLELPLSRPLMEILNRRWEGSGESPFVFPGADGKGAIRDPKTAIARVREKSGVYFTCHDLRRTFSTVAESLDIPAYALKRLLNLKTNSADVTAGYVVLDVERLRDPMEKIGDFLLKAGGREGSAEVVNLRGEGAEEGNSQ